jgi:enterochelin esterase-like enzyme
MDPRTPLFVGSPDQGRNELRMPGWKAPDYLAEPKARQGLWKEGHIESAILGQLQEFQVYLPAGYENSEQRYPLLIVNNGQQALEMGKMDYALENLIGKRVAPLIAVFVNGNRDAYMGEDQANFARFLAEELIPHLDGKYRTQKDAASRGIMGLATSALFSTYAANKHAGSFGRLAVQSFVFSDTLREQLKTVIRESSAKLSAFVVISSNDYDFPGFDAEADSRELADMLKEKGHQVKTMEVAGAPSWGSWRGQTGAILEWFAPAEEDGDM